MRLGRLGFILLAFYFVFLGGSAYYTLLLPARILHHVVVTALLALWLIRRIRSGDDLPLTPLNLPLYALLVAWLFAAAAALDARMALENAWFLVIHVVIFFVLVDLLQRGREKLLLETQFLIAAMVVFISGMEVMSWYFGWGLGGEAGGWHGLIGQGVPLPLERPPRLTWAMNNSNWVASYAAPLITLIIGWALTTRLPDFRRVLWLLAGTLFLVLALTLSRGGLLSLGAALGVLALLRLAQSSGIVRRFSPRVILGMGAVGMIAAFGLFMLVLLSPGRTSGDLVRLDMYRSAVEMTRDYPVSGVGPGLFGRALREYRDPSLARDRMSAAHNIYLNTSAETGLIGAGMALWVALAFLRGWYANWQRAESAGRRIRLEVVLAALVGLALHNMVDTFTTTPMILLVGLLAAYGVTPPYDPLRAPRRGHRWAAAGLLIIIVGYGLWLLNTDRAHQHYQNSVAAYDQGDFEQALREVEAAVGIDPGLNLYRLHRAYVIAQRIETLPRADLGVAINAYREALALEPTWDVGWMNLAALHLRRGETERALGYFDHAMSVNALTPAGFYGGLLAEEHAARPAEEIMTGYREAMASSAANERRLPLAEVWQSTELLRETVINYAVDLPADRAYRILSAVDPDAAQALIPEQPDSAAEWWAAGQHALIVDDDPERAAEYFSEAIRRDYSHGDYYAARARATLHSDPASAWRDLEIAQLLGTRYEYPNAIRAEIATDPEQRREFLAAALPPRTIDYGFAGVLFGGRISAFDLLPEVRYPGPGREAMQPWYTLAGEAEDAGRYEEAARIYRAILAYAPDESEARQRLQNIPR
jgi:tetratricopeptide (TPR) repeat protein